VSEQPYPLLHGAFEVRTSACSTHVARHLRGTYLEPFDLRTSLFQASFPESILEIDALHTIRDTRQHLIGDGAEYIAEFCDGQMLPEDFHLITL